MVEGSKIDAMPGAVPFYRFRAYLNEHPITLTYQFAQELVTPIDVIGDLVVCPNGTVWSEPCLWGFISGVNKK